MAVTVLALFWVSLVLSVIGSNASGELNILHSPASIKFSGASVAMESTLKEIFSAALGLSVEENAGWTGLTITDPFATAKAVVEVYVDGISSISDFGNFKGRKYEIAVDEFEPDTYEVIKHRIEQRYTNGDSNLINVNLNNPNEVANSFAKIGGDIGQLDLENIKTEHLKYNVVEDMQFLSELAVLRAITEQVKANRINIGNTGLDFYHLIFSSLHPLSDFHGPNSPATKEAKKLLVMEMEKLASAFEKAYNGAVLVSAVTTDVAHTRRAPRSKRDVSARASLKYSEDYAAIFNIILWFSVVFTFAMIAVVYALVDMDPGRDSIIYRMTSTRMKKDN